MAPDKQVGVFACTDGNQYKIKTKNKARVSPIVLSQPQEGMTILLLINS